MRSVFGTILDPAADKTLMTTLVVTLAYKGLLPGTSCYARFVSPPEDSLTLVYLSSPLTSPPCRNNHRPGRPPLPLGVLLPIHLPPSPQDLCPVLGLWDPERRGQADADQQV